MLTPVAIFISLILYPAPILTPPQLLTQAGIEAGWNRPEIRCAFEIVRLESRWDYQAKNKHSSARGLFQILNTRETASIQDQIEAGIKYFQHRFNNNPCQALEHHRRWGWY